MHIALKNVTRLHCAIGKKSFDFYLVMAIAGHCGLYLETNSAVLPEVVIQMMAAALMW